MLRERIAWRHPEWWSLALSALAWCFLLMRSAPASAAPIHHRSMSMPEWLIMVVAMMLPLNIRSLRATAARSLWHRRHRAMAAFLLGYLAPWTAFGIVVALLIAAIEPFHFQFIALATGFAIAALWQLAGIKRRALSTCHQTMPLAPIGWQADRDCVRYGWIVGGRCVVSCGALMIGCALCGHSLPALTSVTLVAAAERYEWSLAPLLSARRSLRRASL